jgi:glycosyltransferase involved in cell wall biosynthesis
VAKRIALVLQRPSAPTERDTQGLRTTRDYLFPEMFDRTYDSSSVEPPKNAIEAKVPGWLRLAQTVHARRHEYDAIVSWGERVTLALMAMDAVTRDKKPHVALLGRYSKPNVRVPLKLFGKQLLASVTWCEVQRNFAISHSDVGPEKIFFVPHYVDDVFWNPDRLGPGELANDIISSAGAENRDFATLIEALRGSSIPCQIASSHVRIDGLLRAQHIDAAQLIAGASSNVTMTPKNRVELRQMYGRSRFVVLPLMPSNVDNGVTVLLEAMAMGKAVICSGTEGQVGVVEHGVTGLYVPPRDPAAMRRAIEELWNDPERAAAMGRAGREFALRRHRLDMFCSGVKQAVDAALAGGSATLDGRVSV